MAEATGQERRTIMKEYAGHKAVWSTGFRGVFAYKNYSIPAAKQRNHEVVHSLGELKARKITSQVIN